jgi:hypothetical protein
MTVGTTKRICVPSSFAGTLPTVTPPNCTVFRPGVPGMKPRPRITTSTTAPDASATESGCTRSISGMDDRWRKTEQPRVSPSMATAAPT